MIAPSREAPTWLRDVPLAHRGLHGDAAPENSLAAFAAARDEGIGIELDVQLSEDGVPVVFHDRDLERLTGVSGRLSARTCDELGELCIAGSEETIPTLQGVLEVVGDAPTMVEIKNDTPRAGRLEAAVAAALSAHADRGGGPACVASFNPWSLRWLRRHRPSVVRVLTAGPMDEAPVPRGMKWSVRTLRHVRRVDPVAVSYDVVGLDLAAVQDYRREGGTVVAWTVRSLDELARARRLADNVIFESLPLAAVRTSA